MSHSERLIASNIIGGEPVPQPPLPDDTLFLVKPGLEPGALTLGAVLVETIGGIRDIRFAMVRVTKDGRSGIQDSEAAAYPSEFPKDVLYKDLIGDTPALLVGIIRDSRHTKQYRPPVRLSS
jgi:hypothetical protein